MENIFVIAQAIVSVLLIILILFQQRGTALGSAFGGGGEGFYSTRRGIQKKMLYATIALGSVFMVLAILNFVIY